MDTPQFDSPTQVLDQIKARMAEIANVSILVSNELLMTSETRDGVVLPRCCGTIEMEGGEELVIHAKALELLLNDGILYQLRIPISLVARESRMQQESGNSEVSSTNDSFELEGNELGDTNTINDLVRRVAALEEGAARGDAQRIIGTPADAIRQLEQLPSDSTISFYFKKN